MLNIARSLGFRVMKRKLGGAHRLPRLFVSKAVIQINCCGIFYMTTKRSTKKTFRLLPRFKSYP